MFVIPRFSRWEAGLFASWAPEADVLLRNELIVGSAEGWQKLKRRDMVDVIADQAANPMPFNGEKQPTSSSCRRCDECDGMQRV